MSAEEAMNKYYQTYVPKPDEIVCILYVQSLFIIFFFFFSSRRRHTRYIGDWSSDVCSSDLEAVSPENREVVQGLRPALYRMPLLGDVHQGQVQQLDRRFFIGEGAAGLDHLAQSHVQRLYCVGRVDDFADVGRECEEGHDLLPVPAPELADRAVFGIPFGGKDLQLLLGGLAADGSINYLQIGHHRLGVFPT